jgi:peptidoglycan hydrolase CwlO-like protein
MTKKLFYALIVALVIAFLGMGIVFANTNTDKTTIGNEITSSMDKTRRNVDNLVDSDVMTRAKNEVQDAGQDIKNGAENVGSSIQNGVDNIGNGIEDMVDGNNTENRAVAGTTGNYGSADSITNDNNTTGMSGTTWAWIIIAVITIIIVAAVWYYVAQR